MLFLSPLFEIVTQALLTKEYYLKISIISDENTDFLFIAVPQGAVKPQPRSHRQWAGLG
jgi:hypothetical protein